MSSKFKPVIIWLFTGAILVFIMTAIGGITRLTESGLSMVDWNLIMGAIPPMTEEAWQSTFEKYQQFPEFKTTHSHFTVDNFKSIFFWEYLHRLFGRLIGIVFIIPFIIFIRKGLIKGDLLKHLIILLGMGAFQGFLGWYMVSSGLVHEPRVSHFRLAAHLSTAFFTIGYSVWLALGLMQKKDTPPTVTPQLKKLTWLTLGVLALQIIFGAFVAGKDAGTIHNFWPHMNPGEFISPEIFSGNFLENLINHPSGIQFSHRYIAYIVVILVGVIWYKSRNTIIDSETKRRFNFILGIVIFQFIIGIFTLLTQVPLSLGLIHQLGALLLLLSFIYTLRRFSLESK